MTGELARLYGEASKGFTSKPEIQEILAPYLAKEVVGNMQKFDGLPAGKAADLLKLLPKAHEEDRQNNGPTWKRLVEVGLEFGQVWFYGYLVNDQRDDERVSIEGFYAPVAIAMAVRKQLNCKPDEWTEIRWGDIGQVMKAWWD